MIQGLRLPFDQMALEGMDPDAEMAVGMVIDPEPVANTDLDTQLLLELSSQACLQAFPPLPLSPGKLPQPSK
jgi:hypothetical protein